jgi:hypothetical protein
MATPQPARGSAAESMSEFAKRRNREQATRGQAKAAAHRAFGEMLRAKAEEDFPTKSGTAPPNYDHLQPNYFETPAAQIGHPGAAESFIPIWGPTREAFADLADGKPVSAAGNTVLAGLDALGAGEALELTTKGGAYALRGPLFRRAEKATWPHVRGQMRRVGLIKKAGLTKAGNQAYEDGHHWFLPQKWKWAPKSITNHPANIHSMEKVAHARVHHSYLGLPRFGLLERYWRGTPHWSKVATGSATGHAVGAANAQGRRK